MEPRASFMLVFYTKPHSLALFLLFLKSIKLYTTVVESFQKHYSRRHKVEGPETQGHHVV
jgi:hypothetical protein